MLNLNSTIDMDVKTFLRWWGHELSFLVPEKIRQLLSEPQGFIIVSAEKQQLTLTYQLGEQVELLATLARDMTAVEQYKDLLATDERLSKAKVILRLSAQDAIEKELALPIAAKENLHQVVAYEMDRYTPFKADQVYFAVQKLPKKLNNDPDQLKVQLVLTPKTTLNTLYTDVNTLGIVPLIADYEGVANDIAHSNDSYNLLPAHLRPEVSKISRIIHTILISSVFLLLVAVIVMPVWLESQSVDALTQKVKKLEKEANSIKALQLETAALMEETQRLLNEKTATPSMLTLLNSLSILMKDDTRLAYLQYADGQLQIQGESPAASTLISVLEDSELFNNAAFASPVTQDSITKQEHFQITVEPTKPATKADTDVK
ncbi:MAG: pilus assembly protein PilM [Methylococcales bacterium]|jgi:general secretion pathway protein L|nr:pilus assembly protein PilM [Methylococcales bacterium]